jgi:bloom syndrome protein
LDYSVVLKAPKKEKAYEELLKHLAPFGGATGIVYCLSRAETEEVASFLRTKELSATHYHANLSSGQRTAVQRAWQTGDISIVVATIAYGMGIDKADVRFVVHFVLPKSIEGYYQETGRAGRDGKRSTCIMMHSKTDGGRLKRLLKGKKGRGRPSKKQIDRRMGALDKVVNFCNDSTTCRRRALLDFFGEAFRGQCGAMCDNCRRGAGGGLSSSSSAASGARGGTAGKRAAPLRTAFAKAAKRSRSRVTRGS